MTGWGPTSEKPVPLVPKVCIGQEEVCGRTSYPSLAGK